MPASSGARVNPNKPKCGVSTSDRQRASNPVSRVEKRNGL